MTMRRGLTCRPCTQGDNNAGIIHAKRESEVNLPWNDDQFSRNSEQRGAGLLPHGMIGTVEVEFCGLPSMIRSE